jgi:hypothetical protein
VIRWISEHPEHARAYWCAPYGTSGSAAETSLTARERLPTVIAQSLEGAGLTPLHEVSIEYTVGVFQSIVDYELREGTPNLTRLAERLTRLAPLLEIPHREG